MEKNVSHETTCNYILEDLFQILSNLTYDPKCTKHDLWEI